jgi:RecB family exonuclease
VLRQTVDDAALAALRDHLLSATDRALDGPGGAEPGWWCSGCPALKGCPAIPQQSALRRPATPPRSPPPPPDPSLGTPVQPAPGALVLSPTRYRLFQACPRRYFLAHVVQLGGDPDDPTLLDGAPGIAAHDELRARHADPARHDDPGQVDEEAAPDPTVLRAVRNHRAICPRDGATYLGGEVDLRFLIAGKAVLLTGRADALWRYPDGTLEVRDYKTGHCPPSLDTDLPAALYALLAHHHPSRPSAVRVVYERLGGETPGVVELQVTPDALQHAFEQVVAFADRVRSERAFPARPNPGSCRTCPYRLVCPHADHDAPATPSAAPGA